MEIENNDKILKIITFIQNQYSVIPQLNFHSLSSA